MATFTPVNSFEMVLRTLLTDRNTPHGNFYTPLAAAPLWIIVQNHPELDGSNLVAPPGENPAVCLFKGPQATYIGLYTSLGRAQVLSVSANFLVARSTPCLIRPKCGPAWYDGMAHSEGRFSKESGPKTARPDQDLASR